jgi:fused signal recognition particle receptor
MASFAEKIKSFFKTSLRSSSDFSDDFFDDLCDLLVEGDFGAALAMETVEQLREQCKKEKIHEAEKVKQLLRGILHDMLDAVPKTAMDIFGDTENGCKVMLLLGVNGVGKTTTAAKLAQMFQKDGKTMLAAADTFRAAAIDQLKIHGERLGVRVVAHKQGGDPAAVLYDALAAASSGSYKTVIADTAGRMHTKTALIEELKKIDRVIDAKKTDDATQAPVRSIKLLVLDATTGTNALAQAETFCGAVHIDGVILTKFDSAAKGGVIFSLAKKLNMPVIFICNGEKYEDIAPFNADDYIREFLC